MPCPKSERALFDLSSFPKNWNTLCARTEPRRTHNQQLRCQPTKLMSVEAANWSIYIRTTIYFLRPIIDHSNGLRLRMQFSLCKPENGIYWHIQCRIPHCLHRPAVVEIRRGNSCASAFQLSWGKYVSCCALTK